MSTVSYTSMNLSELLSHRDQISSEIFRQTGGDSSVVPVKTKVRKTHANKGKPNVRGAFTKKITAEHPEDLAAYKEANPDQKVPHLKWPKVYIDAHKEEYDAFKAAWALEHPKTTDAEAADAGDSNSESQGEAAGGTTTVKPKKVLSPEHLAKLKAGREAKLAEKKAAKEKELAAAEANAPFTMAAVEAQQAAETATATPVQAKKGPKKVTKKTEPAAAPAANTANAVPLMVGGGGSVQSPIVAEPEEGEVEPLPFKHNGITYIRIGTAKSDGSIDWISSDLWFSKKGQRGPYAGELMPDGDINEDAEEPKLV